MEIAWGSALAFMGIAFAVVLPGIGSARTLGILGEQAAGVITEEPERFGQALLLQALPGTQGIYGLLIGFMIMSKIHVFDLANFTHLTVPQGWMFFIAALPVALVGLLSSIFQGKACAGGLGVITKRPEDVGKAITLAAMVETYAVLGFLASLLLINGIPL
ncbi:MAG: V-type ATP synthase subunit K [Firmicutes bacterium]|nr:V-type ATP synthase subunit K [Bacillota bacterium]